MCRRRLNVRTRVTNVSRSPITGRTPSSSRPEIAGRALQRTHISGKVPEN